MLFIVDYSDTDEETDELLNKPYSHSATVDIPELTSSSVTQVCWT